MKLSLKREVGLFGATSYGVGIILGAGIYALIGPAASVAGNSIWISFIIGALISSFTGLSYAELSTMFPKAAAEYVYVKSAFNNALPAFLTGWLIIFTGAVSASTVALGFASYFKALFNYPIVFTALILIALLSFLNFCGIEESSRVNVLFTAIEIAGLLLIIFLGMSRFGKVNYFETPSVHGIFSAAALMFFAYLGFEDIVNIAEETKNPTKNLPRALILSVLITTILYVLVALSAVSLANWKALGDSDAPLAYAASKAMGDTAFSLMSYIALFATANTVLIISIVGSRMIYGMAKAGALPPILSRVHFKTSTPWIAVICTMSFSMFFVLLGDIGLVASITSFGVFITFAFVNLSLIWLRYKRPELKRPFKVPINVRNFPIMAFLGLFSCVLMVTQFDLNTVLFGIFVIGLGIIAHMIYRKISGEVAPYTAELKVSKG
jgi:APA family basic amino acid/polyamine antiporter